MNEFLTALNQDQWMFVPYINGVGIEISNINDGNVVVFPRAVKPTLIDNDPRSKYMQCLKVTDLETLPEIKEDELDYIIVIDEVPLTGAKMVFYTTKLKPTGFLCTFTMADSQPIGKVFNKGLTRVITPNLPEKNIGIMRLGAIGDLMQITSPVSMLKKQNYHITVYAQNPAASVLEGNPDIDILIKTDREVVRNQNLRQYWEWLEKKHYKFINLCGTVEDAWLPNSSRPQFHWDYDIRHEYLNENYVEFQAKLCGVKHKLNIKFYPTDEELEWAKQERATMAGKKLICYSIHGSSYHKLYPWMDVLIARVMLELPDVDIVTLGDENSVVLEGGWQKEPRVHLRSAKWTIRQSLTFVQQYADLLIGPETGIMNAMSCEAMKKIIFLSHSSIRNLTRNWVNTASLEPAQPCHYCRHRLHMQEDGWKYLNRDEETGVEKCQADIHPDIPWSIIWKTLK